MNGDSWVKYIFGLAIVAITGALKILYSMIQRLQETHVSQRDFDKMEKRIDDEIKALRMRHHDLAGKVHKIYAEKDDEK